MLYFDLVVRFSTVGLLLVLALFMLSSQRHNWSGRILILLCISLTGLLLGSVPREIELSRHVRLIFQLIDVPNTILVWLFAMSLLDDNFSLKREYWVCSALYCIPLWLMRLDSYGLYDIFSSYHFDVLNIFSGGLFVYLIVYAIRGISDDLVQPRRQLRHLFVFSIILLTLLTISSEFVLTGDSRSLMISFKILVILPLVLSAFFWILQVKPDHFAFGISIVLPKQADIQLTGKAAKLKSKLDLEVVENRAWEEPNLTIPVLSGRLAVTEHTLRALINRDLGFRNFSTYLNGYRIAAIKTAFENSDTCDLPILTLALDNGFNSLPPFNRAFKLNEGVTPSVYRARLKKARNP